MIHIPVAGAFLLWLGGLDRTASGAAYSDAVLADGPIAYWRFEETSQRPPDVAINSGELGEAANGFYYGAPMRQQSGAIVGSADPAVAFDGVLQKLDVPHQAGLNPASSLTVELWVRATGGQGMLRCPLSSRHVPAGQSFGYLLTTTLGNQWEFRTHNGLTANRVVGGTVLLGVWTHVAGVYDGVATRLYVNGLPAGAPITNVYQPNAVTPLRIGGGANEGGGAFFWPGSIDEVAIYNTALSAATIAAHFAAGTNVAPPLPYDRLVSGDRPVGYWRLNEASGLPLVVAVNRGSLGAEANGTYQSGASPGEAGPRPPQFIGFEPDNRACGFDGTSGFVSGSAGLLNRRNAVTLTGWMKRTGAQGLRTGLFGQNDLVEVGYVNDTTLHVRDSLTATNASATNSFADGTWNHLAVVCTGTSLALYTNGALAASAAGSIPSIASNSFRFNIGGGGVFDPFGNFFKGSLDEIAVFDKALSFEQVAGHYFSAVAASPRVSVNLPARTNVYAGDTLMLTLTAVGPGPLQFQWDWNGDPLPGQTSAVLVVQALSQAGGGSYRCRVGNAYGWVTSAVCSVTVLPPVPPTIVGHPRSVTVYAGLTAALHVAALGPGLAYQWQMNRVNLPGATNRSLILSNVTPAQATGFRVIVSNNLGTVTSADAFLTVLVPSPGSFASGVVANQPLAYWRLNETVAPTAFDYAGGEHAAGVGAVFFGGAGPAPPDLDGFEAGNRAIGVGGVDGGYLTVSNSLLNSRSNFTVLGWINRAGAQDESVGVWGQKDVVALGFGDATTLEVWSPRGGQLSVAWPFPPQEWHFVALAGSGTELRVHLDGVLAGRDTAVTVHYGTSSARFNIGGGGILDGLDSSLDGWIDEVALFDHVLPGAEICRLYRLAIQAPLRLGILRRSIGGGPSAGLFDVVVSWPCGTLQQTDRLLIDPQANRWMDVPEALSPFMISNGSTGRFYRIRE